MSEPRWEWGVICDRRKWGLGQMLLQTGATPELAERPRGVGGCGMNGEHAHLLVRRVVIYGEWSDPIAGETAPAASSSPASSGTSEVQS